ncbi:antibiotic biosynthesis monooxygenase family protein [Staphylococcus ratti]|uniref:Signal transduction protein TRAP n=1 Tax=Staphylococcus ratti TaxID=2892440 RepID=A0ABY3PF91_9STAP|nr:antibiotic biosynthesis monooxygenase [Staphylococcus ratti]UEX90868.1 antibiotic biosynthesis monooxygenase [Staphylococcus ratti]
MKLYITYGTYGYIHQIQLNNKDRNLLIFASEDRSVLMEETEKESVFQQPRAFRSLSRVGEISEDDFQAVISIPTSEDHKYQLEKRLNSYYPNLADFEGYKSFRLLKPLKDNVYKVMFGFESRTAYEDFKKSSVFRNHFSKDAVHSLAGVTSTHSSYLERYFYPISEEDILQQQESNN